MKQVYPLATFFFFFLDFELDIVIVKYDPVSSQGRALLYKLQPPFPAQNIVLLDSEPFSDNCIRLHKVSRYEHSKNSPGSRLERFRHIICFKIFEEKGRCLSPAHFWNKVGTANVPTSGRCMHVPFAIEINKQRDRFGGEWKYPSLGRTCRQGGGQLQRGSFDQATVEILTSSGYRFFLSFLNLR